MVIGKDSSLVAITHFLLKVREMKNENLKDAWQKYQNLSSEGDKLRAESDKLRTESYKLHVEGDKLFAEGDKLHAEGDKLRAEGDKLFAEGDKLHAEGKLIWIDAWILAFGKDSVVDWDWGNK